MAHADFNSDAHQNEWAPLMTRVELVKLEKSHIGEKFPYEACHLAGALKALCNQRASTLQAEVDAELDAFEAAE